MNAMFNTNFSVACEILDFCFRPNMTNVLVLDEATSELDEETEREIVGEIKRLKGTMTLIVIAHRLTTVRHCDRIYRLDEGRIIEKGSTEDVLDKTAVSA